MTPAHSGRSTLMPIAMRATIRVAWYMMLKSPPAGVTCNPMFWPARQPETLLQRAVYKFHPRFKGADFTIWWGDSDENFQNASVEGGDVMPVGNGVVFIGMGERTTRQAVFQLARSLCLFGAAAASVIAIDAVYTDFRDLAGVKKEAEEGLRDGFSAKAAIHPDQVAPINAAFSPTAEQVGWARRVLALTPDGDITRLGATVLDGQLIEAPHFRRAERILAIAARLAA